VNRYSGTDLTERLMEAEKSRARYWGNPTYRLQQVNKNRRKAGKPLIRSVEQIKSKRELALIRTRDDAGRFA
jgi:hypothetical protein